MFEFIFGWKKASKCKKLIKKVQCRLNLLKNKRCCLVRQLRNDVAQLIKDGHCETAFNRVDQIYKDECIVAVYDLLAHFCEFISLQLPYIRQHKDCPNDINEAISSLIFASARCGDLPELRVIRKLFSERYGQHFEATALELLPGNLVNFQIKDNLSIKLVPDKVKYKLVEEIARGVLQTRPLALEFISEQHQQEVNQVVQGTKIEQIANVDFLPNWFDFDHYLVNKDTEASWGNSTANVFKKIVYLDDIEELQFPLKKEENEQDQRVFVFRSSVIVPVVENNKMYQLNDSNSEKSEPVEVTRTSRKIGKRSRKTSDIESAIYYNDTSHHQQSGHEKIHYEGTVKELDPDKDISQNSCFLTSDTRYYEKVKGGVHPRAMSMPCERKEKYLDDNIVLRSNSFPIQPTSPHVHPKLPDYDELAAKFIAIKKENLQNQKLISRLENSV